ncbi:MAG: hypothetical protein SGILL_008927 [Bacillariaceae sp.]
MESSVHGLSLKLVLVSLVLALLKMHHVQAFLSARGPELSATRSKMEALNALSSSRRGFLYQAATLPSAILLSTALMKPDPALAVGEGAERMVFRAKPSAPVGALLPAMQQRLLLEAVMELASGLQESDVVSDDDDQKRRQQISSVLLSLDSNKLSSIQSKNQDYKIMKQHSPSRVLSGDLVRAAMNIYTANLNYGTNNSNPSDIYTVTDPSWKKAYIRANDGLPSAVNVINADLDLRDLYRNEVQQKMDDASAEWYSSTRDLKEFRELLKQAASSFDGWLDRISDKDVKEAIQAVLDGKELQLYEPFSSGFLPQTVTTAR